MKNLKWLIGLALLFSAPTYADSCNPCGSNDSCGSSCDPCDMSLCDYEYSAYVELLYWHPCRNGLNYADGDHTRYVDTGYDLGYRLGGFVHGDCGDLHVRYTSFDNNYSSSHGENHGKYDLNLDVIDIELGANLSFCCDNLHLRPFVGTRLAWVEEKITANGDSNSIDHDAYGIYVGAEAHYNLCGSLSLVARGDFGILHADLDHNYHNGTSRDDECHYVYTNDLFVGLEYDLCDICGWDTSVSAGYEVVHFGLREDDQNDDLARLGLGGLTARFSVDF